MFCLRRCLNEREVSPRARECHPCGPLAAESSNKVGEHGAIALDVAQAWPDPPRTLRSAHEHDDPVRLERYRTLCSRDTGRLEAPKSSGCFPRMMQCSDR